MFSNAGKFWAHITPVGEGPISYVFIDSERNIYISAHRVYIPRGLSCQGVQ